MHHLVTAIHDVALAGDKNIISLRQEDFFGFTRFVGKSKKLQIDGWRGHRRVWPNALAPWQSTARLSQRSTGYGSLRRLRIGFGPENIVSCPAIDYVFARSQYLHSHGRIKTAVDSRFHRSFVRSQARLRSRSSSGLACTRN